MSLSAGVDFGLAWKFLPQLSFLERLLLQTFTVFGHLFKATATSGVAIKGSLIALRTDAQSILMARREAEANSVQGIVVSIPRRTVDMDIQFLEKLQLWNRIKSDPGARLEFVQLHSKVFNVSSANLTIWCEYIIHQQRTKQYGLSRSYIIDPGALQQHNNDRQFNSS